MGSTTWIANLGDAEREISLRRGDGGDRWVLREGDAETELDAVRLPSGAWSVIVDGHSFVIDVLPAADSTAVTAHVDGREIELALEDARSRKFAAMINHAGGAAKKGESLRAPIAGKVVKLVAAVGDELAAGDPLIVLEAMKMENELRAQKGGTVTSIEVAAGDSVETGQLLMRLS